jgi:hypothetical protein
MPDDMNGRDERELFEFVAKKSESTTCVLWPDALPDRWSGAAAETKVSAPFTTRVVGARFLPAARRNAIFRVSSLNLSSGTPGGG